MKKIIRALILPIFFFIMICGVKKYGFAGSPNYGKSTHPDIFTYNGYVQCQPSFNDKMDGHAAAAYLRYSIKGIKDTGRIWTNYGYGKNDTRIYSRSYVFKDSLIPNAPKTKFNYGFHWVPDNDSYWPQDSSLSE